ncbi:hypothetical protein PIB30_093966, partial [Stylosanthes scabra]|nr:hypothetical protein [Stylosanthes scabra]
AVKGIVGIFRGEAESVCVAARETVVVSRLRLLCLWTVAIEAEDSGMESKSDGCPEELGGFGDGFETSLEEGDVEGNGEETSLEREGSSGGSAGLGQEVAIEMGRRQHLVGR